MITTLQPQAALSKKNPQFKYLFILSSLFMSTWLTSNITAVKMVSVFGVTLTGGFIVFPFVTTLGLIIVEVYGYKNIRRVIWAGAASNLCFMFFISIVYIVPSSQHWGLNDQFKNILMPGARITAASLISFITAEFLNSFLMARMKISSHGGYRVSLLKRMFFSCLISSLFDITFFLSLAFYGTLSNGDLQKLIFFAYFKKIIFQLILFPAVCYLVLVLKKLENIDIYDRDTSFNPFSFDNVYDFNSFVDQKVKTRLAHSSGVNL